jgi:hypothetical protein
MLKMTVGGITLDFASMIEEVVAANNNENAGTTEAEEVCPEAIEAQPCPEMTKTQPDTEVTETQTSPEATSQGLAQTPSEAPEVD